jgi:hypothetical protein
MFRDFIGESEKSGILAARVHALYSGARSGVEKETRVLLQSR